MGELQEWIRKSLDNLAHGGDEVIELVTPDGIKVRVSGDLRANINLMDETGDMLQDTVRLGEKAGDGGELVTDAGKIINGNINVQSVSVLKETETFIDYINQAGEKIRINKQSNKSILDSISQKLTSPNIGTRIEASVADYINQNTNATITDFANKIRNATGNTIGDIDCATMNEIIEVKKSIASVKIEQLEKYINIENTNYFNVSNKTVILYIDDPVDLSNINNINKLNSIKEKGIIVVNSLEELKGVIQ